MGQPLPSQAAINRYGAYRRGGWGLFGPGNGGGAPGTGGLWFATIADMAAYPILGVVAAWVEEVNAWYVATTSVLTGDNWVQVTGDGGTWVLDDDELQILPIDGTADDWGRMTSAANAMAGRGKLVLRESANRWRAKSVHELVDDVTIEAAGPGVIISSDGMPVGPIFNAINCVFQANRYSAQPVTTHTNADFVTGSKDAAVVDASAIAVDSYVAIRDQAANRITSFQVKGKTGNTLHLDRALARSTYPSGAEVVSYDPPKRIRIIGDGASVVSTDTLACGDRVLNIVAGWDCEYVGWRQAGVWNEFQSSFDGGNYRPLMKDLEGDAQNTGYACFAMESPDSGVMINVKARNAGSTATGGIVIPNGVNCDFYNLTCASNANHGIALATNADVSEIFGCEGCRIWAGEFSGNTSGGIVFQAGSHDNEVHGAECFGNGAGVLFSPAGASSAATYANKIYGGRFYDNTINLDCQGSLGNLAIGITTRSGTLCGVRIAISGQLKIIGSWLFEGLANTNGILLDQGTDNELVLLDSWLDMQLQTAFASAIAMTTTGRCYVKNCEVVFKQATNGVIFNGSADVQQLIEIHGTRQVSGNGSVITTGTSATLYLGDGNDLKPLFLGSATQANVGTFTLNGNTPVAVPGRFPADATIALSLKTVGASPGNSTPYFQAAQIANQFTVASLTNLANDVYNWRAQRSVAA